VFVGAVLSPAGTAGGVVFGRLGQTHSDGRELVDFSAGQFKTCLQIWKVHKCCILT